MPTLGDWQVLPYAPARSQGNAKQCTAFAAVAGMESWIFEHLPELAGRLPLSEADLFRLMPPPRDRVLAALKVTRNFGIVEVGAKDERAMAKARQRSRTSGLYWRCEYSAVPDARTASGKHRLMLKSLEQGKPMVTSIYVDRSFFNHRDTVTYALAERPLGEAHAISIIGYDAKHGNWIAKNSMGPEWGANDGCFALRVGDRQLGAEDLVWKIDSVIPPEEF